MSIINILLKHNPLRKEALCWWEKSLLMYIFNPGLKFRILLPQDSAPHLTTSVHSKRECCYLSHCSRKGMSKSQKRLFPLLRESEQVLPSHQLPKRTSLALRGREAGKDFFLMWELVARGMSHHPLLVQQLIYSNKLTTDGLWGKDRHIPHPHGGIIWREGVPHESMN